MEVPESNEDTPGAAKNKSVPRSFEFISLTNSHKIDEKDRHTVRKQAMKNNTNRRKKGDNHTLGQVVESEERLTGPPDIQQALGSKRFRLLPRGLQDLNDVPKARIFSGSAKRSNSLASISQTFELALQNVRHDGFNSSSEAHSGLLDEASAFQYHPVYPGQVPSSLDPMACLPDNAPYRTRLLIHHDFTAQSRATSLMTSVRKSWFALSLTDLAFFNVVLSHYAGTYRLLTGQGDPMESFCFIAASIKIINERLDFPDQRTSDGTIAAVAGMVLKEIKNGNVSAVKVHLAGLGQMINLRGGLFNARFPASLQRMIAWADLNASSILSAPPRILPFNSQCLDIASYICTAGPTGPILPSVPCPDRAITWGYIDTDLEQIFVDLRYISSILESDDPKDVEQINNMWYSDKTYLVQRSLVYLYQTPNVEHVKSKLDQIRCLTASIYVDSCLRDQRFRTGAIGILVSRLKSDLECFLLGYDSSSDPQEEAEETLLWVCAFGAIASYGSPERGWFIGKFVDVCGRLDVDEWGEVERMLRRKLWNEEFQQFVGYFELPDTFVR
ncbi:hypothetical protein VTL71DRAFT_13970 [Oculimacula yallundae]|uniref:Uncharacterized protein n=1 Tax=Oculimacula yallundae TaxID=86028 RepID=A0ABR4CLW8_9HELO